jgi:S-(hydroxymethyl)glutathione dehydrogenase / alcohol dehydrogenase
MSKIPQTMKAAILVEQKKALEISEIQLPNQLEFGQICVKILVSGICGSQIGEIDGAKGPDRFLPHLLGHEASANVVDIGPGVTKVKPGDYVVLHWMKGDGIECTPPVYFWKQKKVNAGWVTTFNEYAIVSENRLTPVPQWLDPNIAALLGCAVTTGLGVISNNAKLKFGESIIIFGAGGVGLNIIQGAAIAGAYPIIGIDIVDKKLELAKEIGATHVFDSHEEGIREKILEVIGPQGADVVVDNTGNPEVIQLAYELTQPKGRTVLVGVPKKGSNISIYSLPLHFGKCLTGSHGGETKPSEDIPRYVKMIKAKLLKLDKLITHVYSLDEINIAIEGMRAGKISGRCMVKFSSSCI